MPLDHKTQQVLDLGNAFIEAANEYTDNGNTVILMAAIDLLLQKLIVTAPSNSAFVIQSLQTIITRLASLGN
jgi:hypothetical protein